MTKGISNKNRIIDKEWDKIFDKYDILNNIEKERKYYITANEIKEFKEPRLMTKFDFTSSLPYIFKKNNLSILPTSRGNYVIGKFKTHQEKINKSSDIITKFKLPYWMEAIDLVNSEDSLIHKAYSSNIISDILNLKVGEPSYPVLSGRMGSGNFSFNIADTEINRYHKIDVSRAQIEIDATFESRDTLLLIEAKAVDSKDFIIRQLYFPYRFLEERVKKEVIPVFLTYSDNIYTFDIYKFDDKYNYNSLRLYDSKKYMINDLNIGEEFLKDLLKQNNFAKEPKIPFPQADTFENIINLLNKFYISEEFSLSKDEITLEFDFHKRQSDYYSNALAYFGYVEYPIKENTVKLSKKGIDLMKKSINERYKCIIENILSHKVFNLTMRKYVENNNIMIEDVVLIMKKCNLYNIKSEETFRRRAQTIISYLKWIEKIILL